MPDLTLETVAVCAQLQPYKHSWNVGGYSQHLDHTYELECSCKGFQFRKTCKHVKQLEASRCTWHGMYDEPQVTKNICPRCGGATLYVQVAV